VRVSSSLVALAAVGCLAPSPPVGPDRDPQSESRLKALVGQLTAEDAEVALEARQKLEGMGPEVVPVLFEKLLEADWTLCPRLLEVLSANGREFAKEKLLTGNDTERIYAALAYELTRGGQPDDYDTREFKAMVQALLEAIKSDDKYLRAAAGLALVYDPDSAVWFEHFHEIVPVLISSFDTELQIERGGFPEPRDVPFLAISILLDTYIGDRLAYHQLKPTIDERMRQVLPGGARCQRERALALAGARAEIEDLRTYWQEWWENHATLDSRQIGAKIIDRNLRILETHDGDTRSTSPRWCAERSLELWTGTTRSSKEGWGRWWNTHRVDYSGPLRRP